jgi:hypothetical protein
MPEPDSSANPYAAPQSAPELVEPEFEGGNPWRTIWTRPRATIRRIIDTDPQRQVTLLVVQAGIGQALDWAAMRHVGDQLPLTTILGIGVVGGVLGGLIGLHLGGWLLRVTGGWLDGGATPEAVRAAIAWASVPRVFALILWLPNLLIFGKDMFTTATPTLNAHPALGAVVIGFGLVEAVLAIWSLVLFLTCLGEAHRFSAWKALAASFLAVFVILTPILVVALSVVMLSR